MPVLEEDHPGRKTKVGVRPLVNLVGQCDKHGQSEYEAVSGVGLVEEICDRRDG